MTLLRRNSLAGVVMLGGMACSEAPTPMSMMYPEADSPAAKMLLARCGHCHVAPHPNERNVGEWPAIMQRMQARMRSRGYPPLDKAELALLLNYLQRHTGVMKKQD
jgi:cytochrome c2